MLNLIRQVDSNWYEGRRTDGGPSGIFPISYVETIVDPQSTMSTPMSSLAPSPLPGSTSSSSSGVQLTAEKWGVAVVTVTCQS